MSSLRKALSPLRNVASPRRYPSVQSPRFTPKRERLLCDEPRGNSLKTKFGNLLTADNQCVSPRQPLFGGWYEIKLLPSVGQQYEKKFAIPCLDTATINSFLQSNLDKGVSWNILGRGSFGTVLEALYKGNYVAAKLVDKQRHLDASFTLENEANGMELCHPNIVHVIKVINANRQFGIVLMEKCCGTELQKLLDDPQYPITETRKIRYTLDIAEALLYCHRKNILHLDVKPRNVIVCDNNDRCKLFDFGSSLNMKKQRKKQRNLMGHKPNSTYQNIDLTTLENKLVYWHYVVNRKSNTSIESTVIYTAPEKFRGEEETPAVDVYSLGITMWQIQQREIPYSTYHSAEELILQVSAGLRPKPSRGNDTYTALYRECWQQEPSCRPSMFFITQKLSEMANGCLKSHSEQCSGEICFYNSLR